jgi:hypothetical protein
MPLEAPVTTANGLVSGGVIWSALPETPPIQVAVRARVFTLAGPRVSPVASGCGAPS